MLATGVRGEATLRNLVLKPPGSARSEADCATPSGCQRIGKLDCIRREKTSQIVSIFFKVFYENAVS